MPKSRATPPETLSVHEREAIKAAVGTAIALLAQDSVRIELPAADRAAVESAFARHIRRA